MRMYLCIKSLISGALLLAVCANISLCTSSSHPTLNKRLWSACVILTHERRTPAYRVCRLPNSRVFGIHGMPSSAAAGAVAATNQNATKIRQQSIAMIKQEELLSAQTVYYIKPEEMKMTEKEKLKKFLWDPQTRRFFGRSGSSWAKIGLFYLIFYGMLAALVAICMWVFFQTLDSRIPKWKLDSSLIGTNPGLGFRPMPIENPESTLIWLQGKNLTSNERWESLINDFLDDYYIPGKTQKGTTSVKKCSYSNPPLRGEVCSVEVKNWNVCSKGNKYMYHKNSPCVFLKLNKIYGWTPQYYTDPSEFPKKMPKQLQYHIQNIKDEELKHTVWITCEGENTADAENLGPIKYYPDIQGFPGYYYPYENSEGYLSPLVAVHFERPKPGYVINVECKAWAKNIHHSRADRTGSVHFELLID